MVLCAHKVLSAERACFNIKVLLFSLFTKYIIFGLGGEFHAATIFHLEDVLYVISSLTQPPTSFPTNYS